MTKSMTGFAYREFSMGGMTGSLEIKSYNNRYLDISVVLASWLSRFEPRLRDFLSSRIVRGKVELVLKARGSGIPVITRADIEAAKAVAAVLREISVAAQIEEPVKLSTLVSVDGILTFDREIDEAKYWGLLSPELESCFAEFENSRIEEGRATRLDILGQLKRVENGLSEITASLPEVEQSLRRQVEERFQEILGDAANDNRMLAEVASLLMKYTMNEEVMRLGSHAASFRRILDREEASAKKLDFFCQEMNREVNTIGSKNMLLPVAETVVELKDALENIREQLRNIE